MFPLLPIAAIGSLALSAGSSYVKMEGDIAAQDFLAQKAENAADAARLQADEVDVHLREELMTVLGTIDTVRAAANIDPSSPTTAAIKQHEQHIADRDRMERVSALKASASALDAEAAFRRNSESGIETAGWLGIGSKVLGGISSLGSFGGGAPAVPSNSDPARIGSLY